MLAANRAASRCLISYLEPVAKVAQTSESPVSQVSTPAKFLDK
jgi:hypothetical protein